MVTEVDVDKIWNYLGPWGRYQRRQFVFLFIAIWSCGFHVLSIVFIGYRPQSHCASVPVNLSSVDYVNVTRVYEECSIKEIRNVSGVTKVTETECTYGWTYTDDGPFDSSRSLVSEWDLVCDRKELAELSQTLMMFGQGLGAFIFTSLADRYGRKFIHIICHCSLFAVTLASALIPSFSYFAVLRTLTGGIQQGVGLTLAIINLELVPKENRGIIEVIGLLFWTTGIAIITPIAYIFRNLSWRYLQICLACLSAWSLIEWWLIDESLRWLIANGKVKEAKRIIQKACRLNKKEYNEVAAISGFQSYEMHYLSGKKKEIRYENGTEMVTDDQPLTSDTTSPSNQYNAATKQYSVVDLVKSRRLFIASLIMWFAWITNSSTYYGLMLISSSLAGNRFLNFILGSIVEYPAAFMEGVMVNRYGRKPTAITFHCICGIALVIATILQTTSDGNYTMLLTATVFTLIGKFAITGSFSTVFLYTPELYPTNLRNAGIGMSSAAARLGGMLAPFSRNLAEVAAWAPGLVFGVMCAIVSVLLFWIPETNQYELPQTLEECEQWYRENRFQLPCVKRRGDRPEDEQQT
ncbi:hypothetical protein ACF0H5_005573 [Mactra antiquata]